MAVGKVEEICHWLKSSIYTFTSAPTIPLLVLFTDLLTRRWMGLSYLLEPELSPGWHDQEYKPAFAVLPQCFRVSPNSSLLQIFKRLLCAFWTHTHTPGTMNNSAYISCLSKVFPCLSSKGTAEVLGCLHSISFIWIINICFLQNVKGFTRLPQQSHPPCLWLV